MRAGDPVLAPHPRDAVSGVKVPATFVRYVPSENLPMVGAGSPDGVLPRTAIVRYEDGVESPPLAEHSVTRR